MQRLGCRIFEVRHAMEGAKLCVYILGKVDRGE
jgi:hypothetical protein